MFITIACLPLTIITAFGPAAALVFVLLASPAFIVYAVEGGSRLDYSLQVQDYVLTYCSTALVAIYFLIVGCSVLAVRLETFFEARPWREVTSKSRACPFSGSLANRSCPGCGCSVNKTAWKVPKRFLLEFLGQQEALLWKDAKRAIEADRHALIPEQGREDLDTLLGFTGNACTLAVASSCVGCHTWQKCFNVGRRLTLTLALASMFFAYLPWAFSSSLEIIGTTGLVAKVMAGVLAQTLAAAALALETKLMATALSFLAEYAWMPKPKTVKRMPAAVKSALKFYSL